ncbi:MAG TPA: DNA polymerase III subunit gamma/tau [Oceanipulchritudo sp.]|nr:DNA polymerase III subunit gamma/tau [Oceanipulchritudo sp.]
MATYQVIARRWRPKSFSDIVGQDHIVRTLKNAIESGRIAHAYLFVGPRGTGKTSTARVFAKALNAEGGPRSDPDEASSISEAIMSGSCLDVIEIDGASNNSVEQIRDLREECQYAPAQCTFKIYIIDEVHMLSSAAFNALLKTLEEPPAHVKFIFATTEAQKLLATIVSRCQRFEFRPISDAVLVERLKQIAEAEAVEVEEGALRSIARLATGGMRDAQSILDQMISFCGLKIAESDVLDVYGLVGPDRLAALGEAMAKADYPAIVGLVETFSSEGRDLYRVLLDIERLIREALMAAIEGGGTSDRLGTALSSESLLRMLDALQQSETALQKGLSEKVNFEVALLRAVQAGQVRALDNLVRELRGLQDGAGDRSKKKA